MLIVTHRLKSSSEFMDRYLPDGPAGGFFLGEKYGMKLGAHICLELVLSWLDEIHHAYATVERVDLTWENCGRLEKGAIVRLDEQEATLRKTLIEKVRASSEQYQGRTNGRLSAEMDVQYFGQRGQARDGRVLDLSPTGVYIEARRPLPRGSEIHLRVEDRARRVMRHMRGRVVRLDFTRGVAGMGVELIFGARRERRAVRQMYGHLAGAERREAQVLVPPPR